MLFNLFVDSRAVFLKGNQNPSEGYLLTDYSEKSSAALDKQTLAFVHIASGVQKECKIVADVPRHETHCQHDCAENHKAKLISLVLALDA